MEETDGIPAPHTRPIGPHAEAQSETIEQAPEAERLRTALDMHEFGVQLYRQRMRREHPHADPAEIDALVRRWLTAPSPAGRLRLPSRERHHGHAR